MHDSSRCGRVHPAILILLAAVIAGVAFWFNRTASTPAELPEVDFTNAAPGVEQRFREAADALREDPENGAVWGRAGTILDVNGLELEAVPFYRRAMEHDPADFRWPYGLGICLRTSDILAAANAFGSALKRRPDYLALVVSAGLAFEQSDRVDDARRSFDAALKIDPLCAPALEGLAALALRSDDLQTARRHLVRATRASPEYAPAWRMLAQIHDRESRPEEAKTARRRASRGTDALPVPDPERTALKQAEGVLPEHRDLRQRDYLARRQPQAAIDDWKRGLALDPESAAVHKRLCDLYVRNGADGKAAEHLAEALRLEPGSALPHIAHGVALQSVGRDKEAEAAFRAGLASDGDSVEVRVHLGTHLCRTRRLAAGTRLLEEAAKADPDNTDALFNLGVALLESSAHTRAATTFERLAELQPRHPRAHAQWSIALRTAGEEKKARSVLQRGLAESPMNTAIVNELAWLLATARDDDLRDGARALGAARKLNDPGFARMTSSYADTLAAALAETGSFTEAVNKASQAAGMARAEGDELLAAKIQERVLSYQNKKAWRGLR